MNEVTNARSVSSHYKDKRHIPPSLHDDLLDSLIECHFYNGAYEISRDEAKSLAIAMNKRGWRFIRVGV